MRSKTNISKELNIKLRSSLSSYAIVLIVFLLSLIPLTAYTQKINPDGYNKFTYSDGSISSEGYMKKGKPIGYWKSYYPNGNLKTEGNRKNEKLDSVWRFYDREGYLTEIIDYKNGIKSGYHKKYKLNNDSVDRANILISKELYVDNQKNGKSYYYDDRRRLNKTIQYEKNYKNGYEKHYDTLGNIVLIIKYSFNNITNSERLNRTDKFSRKQGIWKTFFGNEKLHTYSNYLNDTLNGYFREYNIYGELIRSEFYQMGKLKIFSEEEITEDRIELKKEYYSNGNIKKSGSFKDDKPVGIHRMYNKKGIVTESKTYSSQGTLLGVGIVDKEGKRQGDWKFLYSKGKLKSKGKYVDGKKEGNWLYYFISGSMEQKGDFKKGKPEGIWIWYYENQKLRRTGKFDKGKEMGFFYELTEEGDTLSAGNYLFGLKSGNWFYSVNDHIEKGKYVSGKKEGKWEHFYDDEILMFEGYFIDGFPDGKQKHYYPDGRIKLIAFYAMGNKAEKWKEYDREGNINTITEYRGGRKYKIDGQKVKDK